MKHLAAIHVMRSKLSISEDDYRALLLQLVGKDSCKKMNALEVARVRAHFTLLMEKAGLETVGAQHTLTGSGPEATSTRRVIQAGAQTAFKAATGRPTCAPERVPMVRRIRAQLISLGRLPDSYADAICLRMFGASAPKHYEWCSGEQLHKISGELAQQQRRQGAEYAPARA